MNNKLVSSYHLHNYQKTNMKNYSFLNLGLWLLLFYLNYVTPLYAQISNRSPEWLKGYADGINCIQAHPCIFENPYKVESPIEQPDSNIREKEATQNADYIGGFIAGKSAGNGSL